MAAGTRRRGSNGVRVLKPAECERRYRLALATVGMEALVVSIGAACVLLWQCWI